jgi:hypothetical protein
MSKIQKWTLVKMENKGKRAEWDLVTDPDGRWVRWDDVRELLSEPRILVPKGSVVGSLSNEAGNISWVDEAPNDQTPP